MKIITQGCDHIQTNQKACQVTKKNYNVVTNIYVLSL